MFRKKNKNNNDSNNNTPEQNKISKEKINETLVKFINIENDQTDFSQCLTGLLDPVLNLYKVNGMDVLRIKFNERNFSLVYDKSRKTSLKDADIIVICPPIYPMNNKTIVNDYDRNLDDLSKTAKMFIIQSEQQSEDNKVIIVNSAIQLNMIVIDAPNKNNYQKILSKFCDSLLTNEDQKEYTQMTKRQQLVAQQLEEKNFPPGVTKIVHDYMGKPRKR
jgi:hypothetical protein